MGEASARVVEEAGLSVEDVDLLIPHQANIRIIDATARKLKLAPEQVFVNIASYGNTSAATIPIALTEALEEGRVSPGANIVFAAFGAGLTWAAAVVRWGQRSRTARFERRPIAPGHANRPRVDGTQYRILWRRQEGRMTKVALVTGGSRGIGRAVALELAPAGHRVAVNYYVGNEAAAAEVLDEITKAGGEGIALEADVSDSDAVDQAFRRGYRPDWTGRHSCQQCGYHAGTAC